MKLAVFLLAGGGLRLKPFTNEIPKCLVEVNGQPLLTRMLNYLSKGGIERVILVIGCKGEKIIDSVGHHWKNMKVEYVNNVDWATTNNVVSLNIALPHINEDFILLEGDLIFTWKAFEPLFSPDRMAIADYQKHMSGTLVDIDNNNIVTRFILKADLTDSEKSEFYKTVNIYSFDYKNFNNLVAPKLQKLIDSGQKQVYYEQAIADAVESSGYITKAVNFHGTAWYEIDTEEDLIKAQDIFKDTEA